MIVPNGHDKSHPARHSTAHRCEAAMCLEGIVITEGSLLRITESCSDGITSNVGDSGLGIWNDRSTLDVESIDLSERIADELSDDSEDFRGVNSKTWAVERGVSHAVGVEITSVGIASSGVSVCRVGTSASIAIAHGLRDSITGMGRNSCRNGVCFPDIHLGAAGAVTSNTSVGVVSGWHPAGNIALVKKINSIMGIMWVHEKLT
jgi:hypothetical protein